MCFKTKVSLLLLALFIGAGVFSMNVQPAQAASLAELQQYIEQLKIQIAELQAKLKIVQQQQPTEWCHNFNVNLRIGDRGADVQALEKALVKQGFSVTEHSSNFPAVFDEKMASSVVGFQEKYTKEVLSQWGLKHGTGFVGKSTRAKLNQLYGCGITPVPPVGECNAECKAKGYDSGICRSWAVVPDAQWGCKDGELNIGQTSDCFVPAGLLGIGKTCCCQKEAQEDCRDENYECTVEDIPCCAGLKEVGFCFEESEGEGCICATCGSICRPCGNGVCDANENKCSCPEDCGETGENLPPVIDGITAPTQLRVNEQGVWTIRARDPENGSLSYSVNWGDEYANIALPESGASEQDTRTQTTTFTHRYSAIGTYTIRFTVTDDHRQTARTSTTIKIGGSEIVCTDSDGGINKYVRGRTCRDLYTEDTSSSDLSTGTVGVSVSRFCKTDRCVPSPDGYIGTDMRGYLTEYYCKEGRIFSKTLYCENGCENGACKREVVEPSCVDSDHGKHYYKKGTVTLKQISSDGSEESARQVKDFCDVIGEAHSTNDSPVPGATNMLHEYYCNGNAIASESFNCPNGCIDGACVIGAEPYCANIGTRSEGWVGDGISDIKWDNCDGCHAVCKYVGSRSEGWYTAGDCDTGLNLIKYDNCGEGQEEPLITVTSPNGGEQWVIGKMHKTQWVSSKGIEKVNISYYDAGQDDYTYIYKNIPTATGTIYESEWIVSGVDPGQNVFRIRVEDASDISIFDESDDYFSIVEASETICADTDGGKDYYTKGTTNWGPISGNYYNSTDKCSGNVLSEHYCYYSETQDGYYSAVEYYICPNGCEDGACVIGDEPYCSAIGSRSEGWYENEGGIRDLIRWDNCDGCHAVCKYVGSRSEGWYTAGDCDTGLNLIKYDNCGQGQEEPSITVTSPNGGEQFQQGGSYTVIWRSLGSIDNVKIIICMTSESYAQSTPSETRCDVGVTTDNDGSYSSQFGRAAAIGNYTVRVEDSSDSTVYDESDDYFSIVAAEPICGDVNCDGIVNMGDADLLHNYVGYPGQYTICSEWAADVNCDENIDMGDVILLQYYVDDPIQYSLECCSD